MLTQAQLELDTPRIEQRTARALLESLNRAGVVIVPSTEKRHIGARMFLMSSPFDCGTTDSRGVACAVASIEADRAEGMDEESFLAISRIAASGTHGKAAGCALDTMLRKGGK